MIATVIISARLTPIFESTATVDVDRQMPAGVVGQEAASSVTNDADQFLATQMKLVQSDGVLRPVDQRFRLRLLEKQSAAESQRGEDAPIVLKRLRVTRPPNTYLMLISYRSDDPATGGRCGQRHRASRIWNTATTSACAARRAWPRSWSGNWMS